MTVVAPLSVEALREGVARVFSTTTLVMLGAIEAVDTSEARQTLTRVRAGRVAAAGVAAAVVARETALLAALVHVCERQHRTN